MARKAKVSIKKAQPIYNNPSVQASDSGVGGNLKKSGKVYKGGMGPANAVPMQPLVPGSQVPAQPLQPGVQVPTQPLNPAAPVYQGNGLKNPNDVYQPQNINDQQAIQEANKDQAPGSDSFDKTVGYFKTGKNAQGVWNDPAAALDKAKLKRKLPVKKTNRA